MALLSGCKTNTCNIEKLALPTMPVAGNKVAAELDNVCSATKCPNVTLWLNELDFFRQQYLIFYQELANE